MLEYPNTTDIEAQGFFSNTGLETLRPDIEVLPRTQISLPIVQVELLPPIAPPPTEIAFCKIDVQGGELDFLQGLTTWFKAKVVFEIEVNPLYQSPDDVNEVLSPLESHGYSAVSNAVTQETQTSNWLLIPSELAGNIGSPLTRTTVNQRHGVFAEVGLHDFASIRRSRTSQSDLVRTGGIIKPLMSIHGKRVLVTGASGFIGSHLSSELAKAGCTVLGVDIANRGTWLVYSRHSLLEASGVRTAKLDVRRRVEVATCISNFSPQVVIHLAALAGVRDSFQNTHDYFEVNLLGTLNILEASSKARVEDVYLASSSSVYGEVTGTRASSETDCIDSPVSPYAASKVSMEVLARTFDSQEMNVTCLRFFTVYGPLGRPDMAFWKFTKALLEDREIHLFGDGSASRDFTSIQQLIRKITRLLQAKEELGQLGYPAINLGSSGSTSVLDVIELLGHQFGKVPKIRELDIQQGDVTRTCSSTEIQGQLGLLEIQDSLQAGVTRWVNWVKTDPQAFLNVRVK